MYIIAAGDILVVAMICIVLIGAIGWALLSKYR